MTRKSDNRLMDRVLWLAIVSLLVLGGATGCQPREEPAAPPVEAPLVEETPLAEPPVVEETPTVPPATATPIPEDSFQNPVLRLDFPDPGVLEVDGVYYAFATNAAGRNVQVARSEDMVRWELLRDAMSALPRWVNLSPAHVWAPEAIEIDGRYLLYFTARDRETDRQCIGVAISDAPEGRYIDENERPFICQAEEGGSIDAHAFRDDDGTLYLYWKNDGNCCNMATWIYVQEMSPDGLSLVGEGPTRLIRNDKRWEGRVVEAPTMWKQDGQYYLFYSGNNYGGVEYAVGYATCEGPLGPCEEAPENPILASELSEPPPVVGPGHQDIVLGPDGETWILYHAWEITAGGQRGSRRLMWIDRLLWEDGRPVVQGPTRELQPAP
jgi:beta-xylosidase